MKILTLGDSWTYGYNSTDPATMSWPAQMSKKYKVEVVNLARKGSSNQRAARIGIEELCRNPDYDCVIFPLAPASRTEVLKLGKWHQIWPNQQITELDRIFTSHWHSWNDVQNTIILSFYFMHSLQALNIPLFVTGLSLFPMQYSQEINWIMHYKNDNDFQSLGMPLQDFDIGIKDLDRKLKSLKAIHLRNLEIQPEYFTDVANDYLAQNHVQKKYNYNYNDFNGHPNDQGYSALADYFAEKIGLC